MRALLLAVMLFGTTLLAQDTKSFTRALEHHSPHALDRWMKREFHRQRKGVLINNGSGSYTFHSLTYDSLVVWLRRQPGVLDADWDRCVNKILLWPGHSTIGVHVRLGGAVRERCYTLQEGRTGTITVFGWRPRVRKSRQDLKLVGVRDCQGFVTEQRRYCSERTQ